MKVHGKERRRLDSNRRNMTILPTLATLKARTAVVVAFVLALLWPVSSAPLSASHDHLASAVFAERSEDSRGLRKQVDRVYLQEGKGHDQQAEDSQTADLHEHDPADYSHETGVTSATGAFTLALFRSSNVTPYLLCSVAAPSSSFERPPKMRL